MFVNEVDAKEWGEELRQYKQQRRTQLERDEPHHIVTNKEVKLKQVQFNPLLQTYAKQEEEYRKMEEDRRKRERAEMVKYNNIGKYLHEYDLVNLYDLEGISRPDEREKLKQAILPPNFNDYNIITNKKLDDNYFKNMRVIVEKKKKEKPVINRNKREFNIINNHYLKDHDNKTQVDSEAMKTVLENRWKAMRDMDYVRCCYYDQQKEEEFQNQREIDKQNHGKDFTQRFPPSWKFRESVYLDQTKDVPEEIIMIDQIKKNNKKRYQIRHVLENEYRDRDIENQERKKERNNHRVKYETLINKYDKDFDIVTLKKPEIQHIIDNMPPKPPQTSWEKVQATKVEYDQPSQAQTAVKFINEGVTQDVQPPIQAPPPEEYKPVKLNEQTKLPKIENDKRSSGVAVGEHRKSTGGQSEHRISQGGQSEQRKSQGGQSEQRKSSGPCQSENRKSSVAKSVAQSDKVQEKAIEIKPVSESNRIKTGGFFLEGK